MTKTEIEILKLNKLRLRLLKAKLRLLELQTK